METTTPPRVQLVISGKFIALFLISLALLGGGYILYSRQQALQLERQRFQQRFRAPAYFVNKGSIIFRSCNKCLSLGKLRPQANWKVGQPKEIPATEQHWFLAVEEEPAPVEVSGVLMLPVHPSLRDNPAFGFDRNQVQLVLYNELQRKPNIEQPPQPLPLQPSLTNNPVLPPSEPPVPADTLPAVQPPQAIELKPEIVQTPQIAEPTPPPAAEPSSTERSDPTSSTVVKKSPGNWRVTLARDTDWFYTRIPIVPAERLVIRPQHSDNGETRWAAKVGTRTLIDNTPGDYTLVVPFRPWFLPAHRWLAILFLRLDKAPGPSATLDVETTYTKLPDTFDPAAQATPLTRELLDELKHSRILAAQLEATRMGDGQAESPKRP